MNTLRHHHLVVLVLFQICVLVFAIPNRGRAGTFQWQAGGFGSGDGFFDDAARWLLVDGGGTAPPGPGDTALFDLIDVYEVLLQTGTTPQQWDLDRILTTDGIVTLTASHTLGNTVEQTILNIADDIEVDGGHLILNEQTSGFDDTFTVNVADDLVIREGILEIRNDTTVTATDMYLGRENSLTSEVIIDDGASLQITENFLNLIGLNNAQGVLTILNGTATLAGETRLGVSSSAGSSGVITVRSIDSVLADSRLTLDNLVLGGAAGTGTFNAQVRSITEMTGSSALTIGGSGGTGTVNVEDMALFDTGTGVVTLNSTGTLNISGGTFQANGFVNFRGGTLNLSGGELVLNNGMDAITHGGTFSMTGGTLRVEGGLARLETSLNYGGPSASEAARVFIEDNNVAEVQFAFRIGNAAGTFGSAVVSGASGGSRSTLRGTGGGAGADLMVGFHGTGSLQVTDGALASFRDDLVLADQPGSEGSVFVSGEAGGFRATIDVTAGGSGSSVVVGRNGPATMTIRDGGLVQTAGPISFAPGAAATATVEIGNSTACGGGLLEPCTGTAPTLQSGSDLTVGGTSGGTANLLVWDGGLVVVPGQLQLNAGSIIDVNRASLEIGSLDSQGGIWNFRDANSTLRFLGDATLDATDVAALGGTTGTHNRGTIEVAGLLTLDGAMTLAGGDLTAGDLVTNQALDLDETFGDASTLDVAGTATINNPVTHTAGTFEVDELNLVFADYFLEGGTLRLRTGTGLTQGLDFGSGVLELTDSQFAVGSRGILGAAVAIGASQTLRTFGQTKVEDGASLENTGGNVELQAGLLVEARGVVDNRATLEVGDDLAVLPGGRLSNSGTLRLVGAAGHTLSGGIDNSGTILLERPDVAVGSSGLTLSGGGVVNAQGNARIRGSDPSDTINNVDNLLAGVPASRLELADLKLVMGRDAVIGSGVDLVNVALRDGTIDATAGAGTTLGSGTTIEGLVQVRGGVSVLGAGVLAGSELQLMSPGLLTVSPNALQLDGRLRAEQGAIVSLPLAGNYDWSGGSVSLADDSTHQIDPAANLTLTTPLEFDNLTVTPGSTGFVRALFGAAPVVGTNQALVVAGTTTLEQPIRVDGGSFSTGVLSSYENLVLQRGEFRLTGDDLRVAAGAAGSTFFVGAGLTVVVDQGIDIAAGSRLVVTAGAVEGGTLANSGSLDAIATASRFLSASENPGVINAIDSTLDFDGGLTSTGQINLINSTINGPLNLSGGAAVAGDNRLAGPVRGAASFAGSGAVTFADLYAPGDSPAEVTFAGDFLLNSTATLEIELGGTTPASEYDRLVIAGTASLAGTLDVSLIDAGGGLFAPSAGDTFDILTAAGGLLGTPFDTELLPPLDAGLTWSVDYAPTQVRLLVLASTLPSDFNGDGDVDGEDFLAWQGNFGTTSGASRADGDADGDGDVDGQDFLVWQSQFGTTAGGGEGGRQAIPEPGSAVLLVAAVLVAIGRRGTRMAAIAAAA